MPLQVPKCFVPVQFFYVRPKIHIHIVPVTNILCQTKRWFAFSKIGFCAGTKVFEEALNTMKFLEWLKTFGPAQNILRPIKGQGKGINPFIKFGFCAGTKVFEEALNAVKVLGWLKNFGPAQNIFVPIKGQGTSLWTDPVQFFYWFTRYVFSDLRRLFKKHDHIWAWRIQTQARTCHICMACSACTTGRLCLPIYCNCYIHSAPFIIFVDKAPYTWPESLSWDLVVYWTFPKYHLHIQRYGLYKYYSIINTYVHYFPTFLFEENIWPWKITLRCWITNNSQL